MSRVKIPSVLPYDKTSPTSIFEYSKGLLKRTLRDFLWEGYEPPKGKGALGQMVENLYFFLATNSNPASDFSDAGLELKCTPLLKNKSGEYRIKERLVCNLIDYCKMDEQDFEHSHFFLKCQLMLLLFYLHQADCDKLDLEFIYSSLWKLPEKDLLVIKHDYNVIRNKILKGEAHLLSEGDTEYLGACKKGHKGDNSVPQPYSPILASKRAFSLKPAYMRTVLAYIVNSKKDAVANFEYEIKDNQLVTADELRIYSFEDIILKRLNEHKGKSYRQLCDVLGSNYDTDKGKYAHIASKLINSDIGNVNQSEEFKKAGLQLKTIRIEENGRIKEAMSFENIDYQEVLDTEFWCDSRLYEIFSGRFLFAVFKADGGTIEYTNKKGQIIKEKSYSFEKAFFWTMPVADLDKAEYYWEHIKKTIADNHIDPQYFNSINNACFHVRPKGRDSKDLADNPNGGKAKKYCYWFNNSYVKEIVNNHNNDK